MGGGLISPALSRAWENYFGQKGGQTPGVMADVVPVIIIDDDSQGPYPPHRRWAQGGAQIGGVGTYAYGSIGLNDDPTKQKSVAVVDTFLYRTSDGCGVSIDLVNGARLGGPQVFGAPAIDVQSDMNALGAQMLMSNVGQGNGTTTQPAGGLFLPRGPLGTGAGGPVMREVPRNLKWIIGGGWYLLFNPENPNVTMEWLISGRYYASL